MLGFWCSFPTGPLPLEMTVHKIIAEGCCRGTGTACLYEPAVFYANGLRVQDSKLGIQDSRSIKVSDFVRRVQGSQIWELKSSRKSELPFSELAWKLTKRPTKTTVPSHEASMKFESWFGKG